MVLIVANVPLRAPVQTTGRKLSVNLPLNTPCSATLRVPPSVVSPVTLMRSNCVPGVVPLTSMSSTDVPPSTRLPVTFIVPAVPEPPTRRLPLLVSVVALALIAPAVSVAPELTVIAPTALRVADVAVNVLAPVNARAPPVESSVQLSSCVLAVLEVSTVMPPPDEVRCTAAFAVGTPRLYLLNSKVPPAWVRSILPLMLVALTTPVPGLTVKIIPPPAVKLMFPFAAEVSTSMPVPLRMAPPALRMALFAVSVDVPVKASVPPVESRVQLSSWVLAEFDVSIVMPPPDEVRCTAEFAAGTLRLYLLSSSVPPAWVRSILPVWAVALTLPVPGLTVRIMPPPAERLMVPLAADVSTSVVEPCRIAPAERMSAEPADTDPLPMKLMLPPLDVRVMFLPGLLNWFALTLTTAPATVTSRPPAFKAPAEPMVTVPALVVVPSVPT